MKTKHIVALVGVLALLAFATAAVAGTGTLTVKVVDARGMPLSGATVIIQQGTNAATKQTRTTSAGQCSFTGVTTGKTWTVIARDANGKTATKSQSFTQTITVTLQVK
jgi:hypothetical protein